MDTRKRKLPQLELQRRVRARADPDSDLEDVSNLETGEDDGPSELDNEVDASESGNTSDEEDEDENENEDDEGASVDASKISFGALARAQASMSGQKGRRKREIATQPDHDPREDFAFERRSKKDDRQTHRANKHAPVEMTAKRPVSRKRQIVPVTKVEARDPRFDPLAGRLDEVKARKAYAFLDHYRDDEMKQLRAAVKKAKTPAQKEELQRALMSMESKKKAQDRKDKERELLEEHRKQEKELVKQGKKPFYLKKSEQKKMLLMDRFASMSKKQVEKTIEKKRKKVASKEKKELPFSRRGFDSA